MRDLKPAKVKITPDGQVKLRDLGLAKGTGDDGPTGDGYMAPEQVRAERRSTRGPISRPMALVFNELLTGQRAFMGETVSDILAPPSGPNCI